jgi:N6-L-threonylcarbamoyladenine synthase
MKILSIETSCDETGISIIDVRGRKNPTFEILADSLNSQIKIHAPYGGVFPALAKREHQKNLPILLERTLKKAHLHQGFGEQAKLNKKEKPVDLIAVTSGPGLEPALWTGIVFAKELSKKWGIPLIPVNHMEGHILSVFGKHTEKFKIDLPKNKFPILALLISGGHTELVLVNNFGKYKIIGETLDDAAGEAFDKVARMLGLPYPGGPEISKLSEQERRKIIFRGGQSNENQILSGRNFSTEKFAQSSGRRLAESRQDLFSFSLPRPMLHSKNFDFSFSGLKTAVLYLIRDLKEKNPKILEDIKIKKMIAKEFEDAVIETLVFKTKKAIEKYNIKTLIVAGGVSSNKYLGVEMKRITKGKQTLFSPDKKLATDNSVMIGIVGYLKFLGRGKKGVNPGNIKAEGGLRL